MRRKIMFFIFMVAWILFMARGLAYPEDKKDHRLHNLNNNDIYFQEIENVTAENDLFQSQQKSDKSPGDKIGFELSTGIQGIMSFFQLGLLFPRINDTIFIDLKVKYMSSLTWATYIDQDNNAVSFHPAIIGGAVSFGGYSPLLYDCVRMYGGADIFLGYSFTPYDSAIRQTGNLIGDNLTYAIWGYFGLEFFTSEHIAVILDAGGGFKNIIGDKNNQYVIASSWLGSGFGIKMGIRYYL
ncbi:MAG: hypothetical protein JSV25_09740 [Spirochaetota bacterium]|nr:MAG: hypothetical protein JSV25_09740 [Spirochaetota bacterium]